MMKRLYCLLASLAMFSATVNAEVVGFNVSGGWGNPSMEGRTADGCSTWTDAVSNNGTGLVLNGTDEMVTVDWSSNNIWQAGSEDELEDKPYRIYLDDGGNGVHVTINGLGDWLDSIGAAGCALRIYQNSDGGYGEFQDIFISNEYGTLEVAKAQNVWNHEGGGERGTCDVDTMLYSNTVKVDLTARLDGEPRSTLGAFKLTTVSEFYATKPTPENASETPVNQVLTWQQAGDATGMNITYNVYFGDPNELSDNYYVNNLVKTTTTDSADFFYDPGTLENSTEYAWRVDAIVPGDGTYTGYEWKFTTQPPSARIEADPVNTTVPAGTDAQLAVEAINATSYLWYKDGTPLGDDVTDTLYSGEDTATLTIYDVQIDDEGSYYCIVDNSLETPDQSTEVLLMTERMTGWWKFDDDLTDSVNEAVAGVPFFDGTAFEPNYAEGIDGSAYEFTGTEDDVITITGSAAMHNYYTAGYTVSVWVNNTQTSGWGAYISKQKREEEPWHGYFLAQSDGMAIQGLRDSANTSDLHANVNIADGQWHLVTGVFDADNNEVQVYVDGVMKNSRETTMVPIVSESDILFGAELPDATISPYSGLLDDVRIWNYPLDPVTIAKLYIAFKPDEKVCIGSIPMDVSGPDGESDCVVDIFDFTEIAAQWLDCNIVPDCLN